MRTLIKYLSNIFGTVVYLVIASAIWIWSALPIIVAVEVWRAGVLVTLAIRGQVFSDASRAADNASQNVRDFYFGRLWRNVYNIWKAPDKGHGEVPGQSVRRPWLWAFIIFVAPAIPWALVAAGAVYWSAQDFPRFQSATPPTAPLHPTPVQYTSPPAVPLHPTPVQYTSPPPWPVPPQSY